MTTLLFVLFFLAVTHSLYVHASYLRRTSGHSTFVRSEETTLGIILDATVGLAAPQGYALSWSVDGLRGSIGPNSGILEYKPIDGETDIAQGTLQKCADRCGGYSNCAFFQVILLQQARSNNVLCALHTQAMTQTDAKYSSGPTSVGGTVVKTYGLSKTGTANAPPPDALPNTSNAGVSTAVPDLPTGGTLQDFLPCLGMKATVPLIVNDQYSRSNQENLYIVMHGAGARGPAEYFGYLYPILGSKGILVAPSFYRTNDEPAPASFYQPDQHLVWEAGIGSWASGMDAIAPTTGNNAIGTGKCSSFDVFDSLLEYFDDKAKFPNLKTVYFIGHSGGANAISRYSQFYSASHPFNFRFIVANAANQVYADSARPEMNVCADALKYPYQLEPSSMNRYVAARFKSWGSSWQTVYKLWKMQDVVFLIGDTDTVDKFPSGTQNCQSRAQGGRNRRDRNYAFWAYLNIIFDTKRDVSEHYGYDQLIKSGAKAIPNQAGVPFNKQQCIVKGVGHDAELMFKSDCARSAFTDLKIIPGAEP